MPQSAMWVARTAYAELTKFKSKTGEKTKETAVRKLMEMVQSGTIDAEVALEQIKKVADMS